jgi:hypothetical protein
MFSSTRSRLALFALSLLAVAGTLSVAHPRLNAGPIPAPTGGQAAADQTASPALVYVSPHVTAEVAATWAKLQRKIPMPFQNETPLEDVLKYIQASTAAPEAAKAAVADGAAAGAPKAVEDLPLQIYVNPVGLQEAEKTVTSPVTIQLEGVPLATSLGLVLDQLGLKYYVQKDGILMIDAKDSNRGELADPSVLILNTLDQLRTQVAELANELRSARGNDLGLGGPATATPHQGTGGGMRSIRPTR